MAKRKSWYQQGFDDARAGLPSDPPWSKGHPHYALYCDGFADGERQNESDILKEG